MQYALGRSPVISSGTPTTAASITQSHNHNIFNLTRRNRNTFHLDHLPQTINNHKLVASSIVCCYISCVEPVVLQMPFRCPAVPVVAEHNLWTRHAQFTSASRSHCLPSLPINQLGHSVWQRTTNSTPRAPLDLTMSQSRCLTHSKALQQLNTWG